MGQKSPHAYPLKGMVLKPEHLGEVLGEGVIQIQKALLHRPQHLPQGEKRFGKARQVKVETLLQGNRFGYPLGQPQVDDLLTAIRMDYPKGCPRNHTPGHRLLQKGPGPHGPKCITACHW